MLAIYVFLCVCVCVCVLSVQQPNVTFDLVSVRIYLSSEWPKAQNFDITARHMKDRVNKITTIKIKEKNEIISRKKNARISMNIFDEV